MHREEESENLYLHQSVDSLSEDSGLLLFGNLNLNDRKTSINDESINLQQSAIQRDFQMRHLEESDDYLSKTKHIGKSKKLKIEKQQETIHKHRKRRINYLQKRVQELQLQIEMMKEDQFCCKCRQRIIEPFRQKIQELIMPEQYAPGEGVLTKRSSRESLQFQKINFGTSLMRSQQMQQKSWIFLGTMLLAMGSKIMDIDGTMNIFKVMKQSVDDIRRQVQKSKEFLSMQFFTSKQEMPISTAIDGVNFDPFYNNKQDSQYGHFIIDGVKLESVEQYELFYDNKYKFEVKYDALLTIMEYVRQHCSIC